MYDVIGIGAMNVDYILTKTRLGQVGDRLRTELESQFVVDEEMPVDREYIDNLLSKRRASFEPSLGGSAFLTIRTIAAMKTGLKLGYIGISGSTNVPGLDFLQTLKDLGVDSRFVNPLSDESGVCVSVTRGGKRFLRTFSGANDQASEFISNNYDEILRYVTESKVVHVTSFFDKRTPAVVARLLQEAKEQSPFLRISFDPGHHWSETQTSEVKQILRITDFLFMNETEFESLGFDVNATSDETRAERIFDSCNSSTLLVVLKHNELITLFYKLLDKTGCKRYGVRLISPEEVEDSTGAGDVFAGGFLWASLNPGIGLGDAVELGTTLMRSKLRIAGSKSFDTFPELSRKLIGAVSSRSSSGENSSRSGHDNVAGPSLSEIQIAMEKYVQGRSILETHRLGFVAEEVSTRLERLRKTKHLADIYTDVAPFGGRFANLFVAITGLRDNTMGLKGNLEKSLASLENSRISRDGSLSSLFGAWDSYVHHRYEEAVEKAQRAVSSINLAVQNCLVGKYQETLSRVEVELVLGRRIFASVADAREKLESAKSDYTKCEEELTSRWDANVQESLENIIKTASEAEAEARFSIDDAKWPFVLTALLVALSVIGTAWTLFGIAKFLG